MKIRNEKAEMISAQIIKLLEQEYNRGWDEAMKYFAKDSLENDQISRIKDGNFDSIREGEGETA
tara:strand:- start:11 stop:202 length:192 start_codon:yes stop_codon:yes gene_type:complete